MPEDNRPVPIGFRAAGYRTGGLAAICAHRLGIHGGVVARFSLEEQAILAAYTGTGMFQRIDDVRRWAAAFFGVTYSYSSGCVAVTGF